jgi:hypothetical protein
VVRRALVPIVLGLAGGWAVGLSPSACSSSDSSANGIEGPCTRSRDCQGALVCVDGICSEPDAGVASEGGDAAFTEAGNAG